MSLEPGQSGSRTTYQIEITAREKEACERYDRLKMVTGDVELVTGVIRKIALLPKKVVAPPEAEGVKPPL